MGEEGRRGRRPQVAEVMRRVRALAGGLEGERRGRRGLDMIYYLPIGWAQCPS